LLLETDIIVVARPGHPLCADPPATIAELFKYPIALPISEKHYLDAVKRDFGIDIDNLPGRILCSDPSMLARIIERSERLFTAAPRFYFSPEIDAGLLSIVATPVPLRHSLFLHWNRDAYPLPAVIQVQAAIRKAFASL
jgi:DNA-binding transcriptional LysR family regulator